MSRPDDINSEIKAQEMSSNSLLSRMKNNLRIALIGAMDQEIDLLKRNLIDLKEVEIAGFSLFSGTINGVDIVLLKSGIGKVNAAIGTTLLLDHFKPTCVINTGSAGGFDQSLSVGDVVISDEVRHHDVDLTVFGYEIGQMARMPAAYLADKLLLSVAEECISQFDDTLCQRGLIATGDTFMSNAAHVERVRELFPLMKAAEMEAAAIAQTCYRFDVPFIVIRSLSDIAGQESNVSFDQFIEKASENSARMVLAIVKRLNELIDP